MRVESIPVAANMARAREVWQGLEAIANASYFLSWGWIENWIASIPDSAKPELVVFLEGNEPCIAFFLGKTTLIRKHLFESRGWFVNATGIPAFDRIYIEYNGFLCKRPDAFRFSDLLMSLPDAWDEFYLPGLDARSFPGVSPLEDTGSWKAVVDDDRLSPFVDLNRVRAQGGDYLSLLSANTRAQIHRSYRLCEKTAPIRLEIARDGQGALDIYHELVDLHEAAWKKRGQSGAFSSDYMFRFHERLIRNRFEYDEIQLLRIRSGGNTLGCLYNFVYRDNVYFYQSGMNYDLDRRLKPGLVAHAEAIGHNAAAGRQTYDFLGGESRYKMSLATHHNRLIWVRLQKPRLRFRIENTLKTCKHLLAGMSGGKRRLSPRG